MDKTPPPNAYKPGTKLTVGSHTAVIIQYISEGGFAHVYTVEISPKVNNSSTACLKRVAVPDKASLNTLRAEVDSMKRLAGHRHIVSYIDSHAARRVDGEGYEVFVLMEFCANKGLIDFMNTRLQNRLTEQEILRIMGEITEGVCNMHALTPPLIHRDIKIENVLISDNGDFKLCDFGSASPSLRPPRNSDEFAILQNDVLKNTTPQYRSPEMVDLYRHLPIDEKSDIWALGVFLYKLCYYTTPFEAKGELAILHATFDYPSRPMYSDRLKNLIGVLLREDPRRRPNAYQTLEEVCKMRNIPVPIKDFTKDFTRKPQPLPQIPSQQLKPTQPTQPQVTKPYNYHLSSSTSSNDLRAINSLKPIKSYNTELPVASKPTIKQEIIDPFQDLTRKEYLDTKAPPPKPPRPTTNTVASNIQNLNKSLGSLTLNSTSPKPSIPPRTKYVDSIVQTDDTNDANADVNYRPQPRVRSANHKRPLSMYAIPPQSRSNSDGSKLAPTTSNNNELKRIISGISSNRNSIELSPGENNHIDSNIEFLKNLQQQDSGKSWVQQTTGGSIKSLRHISTGGKKRNSLIGQFTGKFSRTSSRASSRASSIHESMGVNTHHTGASVHYRSSSESIQEEIIKPVIAPSIVVSPEQPDSKLKRSSSIQRRVQALLNRNNDPPVVKTAQGYGNDEISTSNIDSEGFRKPTIPIKKRKPPVPKRKIIPSTPPSLSAQTTPSTVTKTTPETIKKTLESPSTIKKSLPPPKPKKPTYLKSSTNPKSPHNLQVQSPNELSRTTSIETESSISDFEEWEQKFNQKYPKAIL